MSATRKDVHFCGAATPQVLVPCVRQQRICNTRRVRRARSGKRALHASLHGPTHVALAPRKPACAARLRASCSRHAPQRPRGACVPQVLRQPSFAKRSRRWAAHVAGIGTTRPTRPPSAPFASRHWRRRTKWCARTAATCFTWTALLARSSTPTRARCAAAPCSPCVGSILAHMTHEGSGARSDAGFHQGKRRKQRWSQQPAKR